MSTKTQRKAAKNAKAQPILISIGDHKYMLRLKPEHNAKFCAFPNLPWTSKTRFFSHLESGPKGKVGTRWNVTEASTGCCISYSESSRSSAVKVAERRLGSAGEKSFHRNLLKNQVRSEKAISKFNKKAGAQ